MSSAPIVPGLLCDRVDDQFSIPWRTGVGVDTVATYQNILDTPAYDLSGSPGTCRSNAGISLIASNSGATATVEVWRVGIDELGNKFLKSKTTLSFTAATSSRGTKFWTDEQYVSCAGSTELRIVITALSAGTVDIRVSSF